MISIILLSTSKCAAVESPKQLKWTDIEFLTVLEFSLDHWFLTGPTDIQSIPKGNVESVAVNKPLIIRLSQHTETSVTSAFFNKLSRALVHKHDIKSPTTFKSYKEY